MADQRLAEEHCVYVSLLALHDSGLLFAAIAESISSNGESVATKLFATDYEVSILVTTIQI